MRQGIVKRFAWTVLCCGISITWTTHCTAQVTLADAERKTASAEPAGPADVAALSPAKGWVLSRSGSGRRGGAGGSNAQGLDAIDRSYVQGQLLQLQPNNQPDVATAAAGDVAEAVESWQEVEIVEGTIPRATLGRSGALVVTIDSPHEQVVMLQANGHGAMYWNAEPRAGNVYGSDYFQIPVAVNSGANQLILKAGRGDLRFTLTAPPADVFVCPGDMTLPDVVHGESLDGWGAALVVNSTRNAIADGSLQLSGEGLESTSIPLPTLPPVSISKIGFRVVTSANVSGEAMAQNIAGMLRVVLADGSSSDAGAAAVPLRRVSANDAHRRTFVSEIDGSVQYYALRRAIPPNDGGNSKSSQQPTAAPALVLSCHGASVEGMGQAAAYSPKKWLHLVAPTNRRPYGFDWEDFGRADAMEVLRLAKASLPHDASRIYLTGHSMGGHGTWHIGSLYPDQFAAIGPSAGWIAFGTYARRFRGDAMPEPSAIQKLMDRGELIGDPRQFAVNLRQQSVYILHGGADDNVPPGQAQEMAAFLKEFHHDWYTHEEPGMGHWWSNQWDDGGATCMDWPEMYDQFARHALPPAGSIRHVQFATANPGVSSSCHWLTVVNQHRHHALSQVDIRTWPNKRKFVGTTENVATLAIDTRHLLTQEPLSLELDGTVLNDVPYPHDSHRLWLRHVDGKWQLSTQPVATHKNPQRYGSLKHELTHRFLFVYGTHGDDIGNALLYAKARLDAETWWYRGNGSVQIVPDDQFQPEAYADRTVVLYGNADTNSAWSQLLSDCPVQVRTGELKMGNRVFEGEHLATMFIRPRQDSAIASVIVIAGTGPTGTRLATTRSLFVPFVRYPDLVAYSASESADSGPITAGYFGADWSLENGEFEFASP